MGGPSCSGENWRGDRCASYVVDLPCRFEKGASYDTIVKAGKDACDGPLKRVFPWTDEEVVCIDVTSCASSSMIDVKASIALTDNFAELGVKKIFRGLKGIPYATTHDCRSIRHPDLDIKVHETRMVVGHFVIQILVSKLTTLFGLTCRPASHMTRRTSSASARRASSCCGTA